QQRADLSVDLREVLYIPGFFQAGVFRFESAKNIIAKRFCAAKHLREIFPRIIITSVAGLTRSYPSMPWLSKQLFKVTVGDSLDPDLFIEQLKRLAFMEVQRVEEVGEYAIRGSIVDFWSPAEKNPARIEFFDDTVEKIRFFHVADQRSFQSLESLALFPAREFAWPLPSQMEKAVEKFNHNLLQQGVMSSGRANLLEDLRENIPFTGIDDLFYLFSDDLHPSFLQIIKQLGHDFQKEIFIEPMAQRQQLESAAQEIVTLYSGAQASAQGKNYPVGKVEILFPSLPDLTSLLEEKHSLVNEFLLPQEICSELNEVEKQKLSQRMKKIAELLSTGKIKNVVFLIQAKDFVFEFLGIARKYFPDLENSMRSIETDFFSFENLTSQNVSAQKIAENIYLSVLNFKAGFYLPSSQTLAISEHWLRSGVTSVEKLDSYSHNNETNQQKNTQNFLSAQFSEFADGDLVVHVQHGIARFRGLMNIKILDMSGDFLVLEYAQADKIYVPIHKMNLVQKYVGASKNDNTILDSLKNNQWEKRKVKAKADAEKLAKELLEHQARRAMTPGHPFSKIDEEYLAFEDAFAFDETPDQLRTIKEIMEDMSKPKAMDRLLCGDVGFGKTEVAMRAAYRCILDGKQVAWLVPTTVLAHQHFRSLKERFVSFAVNIEIFDRSVSPSSKVLERLQAGEIDIIIGTHKLLSKNINFKDLGLLIVDEEQRFGVLQKEKIKTLSYGIDVFSMTATPIPRTLQMAMVGLKDLSLLTTPPKARLATKTFVSPFDEDTIKNAIGFEINRGGQLFYVHNRVEELETVFQYLKNLVPQAKICIGHGKMSQKELEETILDFLDGKFNLLLCTTIIESGIDMPNVNTIIVQNADKFGLAQLYQLRGRVGRRSTRGYAYFLTSTNLKNKDEGMKRLEILKEHQELGSGFIIASHDMEMRGSGNILGDEQSGKVNDVGLETYSQMLDEAIKSLGGVKVRPTLEVEIQVPFIAIIPDNYIDNARERLRIYRRFFGARQESLLQSLLSECEDRFGPLPNEVKNLAELARMRRWLMTIGASHLTVGNDATEIKLSSEILQPKESYDESSETIFRRILDVCNRHTKGMRISPDGRIIFPLRKKNFDQDT
ncbi:MAG: transcription-repair coupling factor, partial [Silvanigrellaceae bacterium]|nr:transcription-repair coupling factor [Silvanigrellaceae bacterium]